MTQTVILRTDRSRFEARRIVDVAPPGSVVTVKPPKRTIDQNSMLWALLSDVSRSRPEGRVHPPEMWKALFMHACSHPVQFENGLNNQPFPVGFRSSRLSKEQMSELIEFILAWGSERGVVWTDEERAAA